MGISRHPCHASVVIHPLRLHLRSMTWKVAPFFWVVRRRSDISHRSVLKEHICLGFPSWAKIQG